MAENMRAIKKRIKGVNSTKQITHAMELVASSKLRKAREKAEARRMYFEEMIYAVRELAILQTEKPTNPFFIEGKGDRTLVVVITANKGLAGGYNNNIIKLALSYCKDVNNTDFIVAGNNGIEYFRYRKYNIIEELRTNSEDPSYNEAKQIEERVISLFKSGNYREINIAYTKFVSTISQKPLGIKLLPLDKDDLCQNSDIDREKGIVTMEYEPDEETVLEYIIPRYILNTIYGAMIESSASEQAARRVAMESATNNANEMIDDLTLRFNRARQEKITQEIAEITGGANASK